MTRASDIDFSDQVQGRLDQLKPLLGRYRNMNTGHSFNSRSFTSELRELACHSDVSVPLKSITLRPKLNGIVDPIYRMLMKWLQPLLKILFARQIRFNRTNVYLWSRVEAMESRILELENKIQELENVKTNSKN